MRERREQVALQSGQGFELRLLKEEYAEVKQINKTKMTAQLVLDTLNSYGERAIAKTVEPLVLLFYRSVVLSFCCSIVLLSIIPD